MTPWRRFSSDPRFLLRLALCVAAVPLGICAESALYGWGDPGRAVPDAVTGWSLVGLGLFAGSRRSASRCGFLLAATGVGWFAGNFAAPLLYVHRGPLIHFALSYPRERVLSRGVAAAVILAYGAAFAVPVWRSQIATIVLAVVLVSVARADRAAAPGPALVLGAVLTTVAVVRLATSDPVAIDATLLLYEAVLCALGLAAASRVSATRRAEVTDLVVELGERRAGTLRDELAAAVGDPSLQVAYPLPADGSYVDASGQRVELPVDGTSRRIMRLTADGREVAAIVHDAAVLDDPVLVASAAAAARLAGANARLQARARVQMAELRASRRRLLTAGEEERRRLEQRLRDGPAVRLAAIAEVLEAACGNAGPQTLARLGELERTLGETAAEFEALAAGLHPRALTEGGLATALPALAERAPARVAVVAPAQRLPAEVELAAYFVCAEALANAAKYAAAASVDVEVAVDACAEVVRVQVTDDGVGGAMPHAGSGLSGLADRVAALGGTFAVASPPGGGTRVTAVLPLADDVR